jgi:hypothetical protein
MISIQQKTTRLQESISEKEQTILLRTKERLDFKKSLKIHQAEVDGVNKDKLTKLTDIITRIEEDEGNDLIKIRNMNNFQDQETATFTLIGQVITSSVTGFKHEQ